MKKLNTYITEKSEIDDIFKNNKQIYQNLSSWFMPKVKSKNNMFMGTKMTSKRSWWPRKYKL